MRIVGNPPSGGKKPTTPTIGTATDGGTGTTVSVAFTPSTYIGKGTITYTATSSPGSLTGTGSGSPITVSGLTTGTAYTFTVTGTTNYGVASDSSAASNSVTPASPSSFESIATFTGSSNSITFSSIPSTYKHLQIRVLAKDTDTTAGSYFAYCIIRLNGDSGLNYSRHELIGNGSTVSAAGLASTSSARFALMPTSPTTPTNTNMFGAAIIDIHDYTSTVKNKTIRAFAGSDMNSTTSGTSNVSLTSGAWLNTNAVTSVTLVTGGFQWNTSSTFALYGIKG